MTQRRLRASDPEPTWLDTLKMGSGCGVNEEFLMVSWGSVFPDRSSLPSNFSSPLASFGCLSYAKQLSHIRTSTYGSFSPNACHQSIYDTLPIATLVPNNQDTELTIEATIKRNSRNACVLGVKNPWSSGPVSPW